MSRRKEGRGPRVGCCTPVGEWYIIVRNQCSMRKKEQTRTSMHSELPIIPRCRNEHTMAVLRPVGT